MIENHVPRNVTWFRGQEKPQLETSWKESRDLSPTTKESDCVSPRKQGGNQPCSVSTGRIWHCQQPWLHCMGSMPELTCRTVQVKSAFFFFYTTKLIVLRKTAIENEYLFSLRPTEGQKLLHQSSFPTEILYLFGDIENLIFPEEQPVLTLWSLCLIHLLITENRCSEDLVFAFALKGFHISVLNFTFKGLLILWRGNVLIAMNTMEPWTELSFAFMENVISLFIHIKIPVTALHVKLWREIFKRLS